LERGYPLLRDDLAAMLPDHSVPIVLVKSNVCRLLGPKLKEDGFNVLNNDQVVFFPSTGRQKEFQRQFSVILKSAKTLTDGSGALTPRRKKRPANVIDSPSWLSAIKKVRNAMLPYLKIFGKEFLTAMQKELEARNEMADTRQRKLHEAMEEVLREKNCRSAFEIADEINRRGLYTQRDGGPVPPSQISARANNYPHKFVRAGDKICLT